MGLSTVFHLVGFIVFFLLLNVGARSNNLASAQPGLSEINSTAGQNLHHHGRRWLIPTRASDEEWDKAICYGGALIDAIRGTDREAAEKFNPAPPGMTVKSPFNTFPKSFETWGWYFYNGASIRAANGDFEHAGWGIGDALRALKVSDKIQGYKDGKITMAWIHHGPKWDENNNYQVVDLTNWRYTFNNQALRASEGHYQFGLNAQEGVIIATTLKSPEKQSPGWPNGDYPKLRRASDILYGAWKVAISMEDGLADRSLDKLRYYLIASVINAESGGIITRVLEPQGYVLKDYPGDLFEIGPPDDLNENALALLGSVVTRPLPFMLLQHKDDFPHLRIKSVRVFSSTENKETHACLLWELENEHSESVPAPAGPP